MAIKLSGIVSGMDTDSMVKELMKAQSLKKTKIENKITTTEWKQDKWKALNTKIYSLYTGALSKMKLQNSFSTKTVATADDSKASITADVSAPTGSQSLYINQLASSQYVTGAVLSASNVTTDTKLIDLGIPSTAGNTISIDGGKGVQTLTITDTTTVNDFISKCKDAGLNASYDTNQKRFFISSKESGNKNAFSITSTGTVDMTKLGLSQITKTTNPDNTYSVTGGANITLVSPQDAKVVYNGADITSSSNTVKVNGLTINLKALTTGATTADPTDDKPLTFTVSNNTQAVYDVVKGFVKAYNEVLKDLNDAYNADSTRGYDPLSDDEKESMTDDQITKWEDKIKGSLLRRDGNVGTLIGSLRAVSNDTVDVNSKKYSLSSFGIGSINYAEKGQLHIDGDSEDAYVGIKEDKLMKALTEDPNTVMTVLNKIAGNLYTSLSDNMKSSTLRSALTFYNDKELSNTLKNYKSDLSTLEDKLSDIETRYYKQFSAMESAMSKLNSQSSNLASMLGN